jgi:hypothetical protein
MAYGILYQVPGSTNLDFIVPGLYQVQVLYAYFRRTSIACVLLVVHWTLYIVTPVA